jgi:hypothetical protein
VAERHFDVTVHLAFGPEAFVILWANSLLRVV